MPQTHRVVSLIASATEIVAALGREAELVGRSHECDHPQSVHRLPACSRPRLRVDASSAEIDGEVKRLLRRGLAIYDIDAELLRDLRPDIIITQDQCEVCAVNLDDVERATWKWIGQPVEVISLHTDCLADLWRDIVRVAHALDCREEGLRLVATAQQRMDATSDRIPADLDRCRVATLEWMDPLMAAGNWMPELIEAAGGLSLFGEVGRHSPWLSWEDLCAADPDLILVSPCGFTLGQTQREMHRLTDRREWSGLCTARRRRR